VAGEITHTRRCLFGPGEFVLMGYDAKDKIVFGVRANPKNGRKWMRGGSPKADLERIRRLYAEQE
jgi:hypothetical protein